MTKKDCWCRQSGELDKCRLIIINSGFSIGLCWSVKKWVEEFTISSLQMLRNHPCGIHDIIQRLISADYKIIFAYVSILSGIILYLHVIPYCQVLGYASIVFVKLGGIWRGYILLRGQTLSTHRNLVHVFNEKNEMNIKST